MIDIDWQRTEVTQLKRRKFLFITHTTNLLEELAHGCWILICNARQAHKKFCMTTWDQHIKNYFRAAEKKLKGFIVKYCQGDEMWRAKNCADLWKKLFAKNIFFFLSNLRERKVDGWKRERYFFKEIFTLLVFSTVMSEKLFSFGFH